MPSYGQVSNFGSYFGNRSLSTLLILNLGDSAWNGKAAAAHHEERRTELRQDVGEGDDEEAKESGPDFGTGHSSRPNGLFSNSLQLLVEKHSMRL